MNKILNSRRKPDWLKIKLAQSSTYSKVKKTVRDNNLNTICTSGNCPNLGECWDSGTATFMILGDICTRACKFCSVKTGKPLAVDTNEPTHTAEAIKLLKLKHCVITSVDRDDLFDLGSNAWCKTIITIITINPRITIEALIPDFQGKYDFIQNIIDSKPNVISHNIETVERLTPVIRSRAKYETSLAVINQISKSEVISKSGIMLGIGETEEEVIRTMDDLLNVGCQVLTIGQYLQPSKTNIKVSEYIEPKVFYKYKKIGLEKGFKYVESSPLVRSSYRAEKHIYTRQ